MKRLVVALFSPLVIQCVAANASGTETISGLTCVAVSQNVLARQSWSSGGAPYGVPLTQWGEEEFARLRARIADCAKQSGTDARGLIAYVHRLEGMTRLQNSAADPARRQAAVDEAHRRSQALNDSMEQAQKDRQRAYEAEKDVERGVLDKVEAFTSSDELKAFCKETWNSQLPQTTRLDVMGRCKEKLARLAIADQQAEEARHAEASGNQLPDLIRKVQEMPATPETARQLQYLRSDNHYRLPSLTYHDQNSYLSAIDGRLNKISSQLTDAACTEVVSKIGVPDVLRDAVVVDGLAGVSLTYFLCGPALTTRNVSVRLAPQDLVEIKVEAFTLTLARRRYLPDTKAEIALDSPIKGGVNALVLIGATQGRDRIAIGNPNFFVINFYSQFTPQVSEFLKQSADSGAAAPAVSKSATADPKPASSSEIFVQQNCHMSECSWGALSEKSVVKEVSDGKLVRAMMRECTTSHPDGDYPRHYVCRPQETEMVEYVAFCSTKYPNIAFRHDGKWQRTKLSISEDGQFGYNVESITQYLRICHDYARGDESLDSVGAKFGYKSRISALGDNTQDTVDAISQLAE